MFEAQQLRAAIQDSLDNLFPDQAVYFAEKFYQYEPTDDSKYLLGLSLYHNSQKARAYELLRESRAPALRFLLARCCFDLNKLHEAEQALLSSTPLSEKSLLSISSAAQVPNGAHGLLLLGLVYEKSGRNAAAIDCFHKCLALNPSMWTAYQRLHSLGLSVPSAVFAGDDDTAPLSSTSRQVSLEESVHAHDTDPSAARQSSPSRLRKASVSSGLAAAAAVDDAVFFLEEDLDSTSDLHSYAVHTAHTQDDVTPSPDDDQPESLHSDEGSEFGDGDVGRFRGGDRLSVSPPVSALARSAPIPIPHLHSMWERRSGDLEDLDNKVSVGSFGNSLESGPPPSHRRMSFL